MNITSLLPTDGLSYNPQEQKYWDEKAIKKEVNRAFEICHGCRMCFKYCDSFPILFDKIDNTYNGNVKSLNKRDVFEVMDSCFQCKLCEVQCPYTPRDGHEFQLDFPKLVHRYKAQKFKKNPKVSLRDKVLGNPDNSAKLARLSLGLANILNRSKIHRFFMEKILKIHRKKDLPDFSSKTFENISSKKGYINKHDVPEVVLFQTCYVQNNEPKIRYKIV